METDPVTMETQSFPVPDPCLSRCSPQRLPIDHSQHINHSQVGHNIEAKIKILLVSPYLTDPEKRPYSKILFQFSVKNFFLISLQT